MISPEAKKKLENASRMVFGAYLDRSVSDNQSPETYKLEHLADKLTFLTAASDWPEGMVAGWKVVRNEDGEFVDMIPKNLIQVTDEMAEGAAARALAYLESLTKA